MTYPSLNAHVDGWVNGTVPQILGLNPGMGGPIHGQQVPNTQFPLNPAANPTPVAPDPVAVPLQTPEAPGAAPGTPLPIEPTQLPSHHSQGFRNFNGNFGAWAANYPNRLPIFNHMMQQQAFQSPVSQNFSQPPAGIARPQTTAWENAQRLAAANVG